MIILLACIYLGIGLLNNIFQMYCIYSYNKMVIQMSGQQVEDNIKEIIPNARPETIQYVSQKMKQPIRKIRTKTILFSIFAWPMVVWMWINIIKNKRI